MLSINYNKSLRESGLISNFADISLSYILHLELWELRMSFKGTVGRSTDLERK